MEKIQAWLKVKKNRENLFFIVGCIAILTFFGWFMLSASQKNRTAAPVQMNSANSINDDFRYIPKDYSGQQTVQDQAVIIGQLNQRISELEKKETNKAKAPPSTDAGSMSPTIPIPLPAAIPPAEMIPSTPQPAVVPQAVPEKTAPAIPVPNMSVDDVEVIDPKKQVQPKLIIPMGSAFKSVPLGGFIALPDSSSLGSKGSGVGGGSQSIPNARYGSPFVGRVKDIVYLPNGKRINALNDCHVIAGGVANISAKRVEVNAFAIRCVGPDGQIYGAEVADAQIGSSTQLTQHKASQEAFAVGWDEDGIRGLQAKVIYPATQALERAFFAGLVGNIGTSLAPQQIQGFNSNFTGGQSQYQTPNPNYLLGSSLGSGLSQSSNLLAKIYSEFAQNQQPAMEVRSGLIITFVTTRDVALVPLYGN